MNLADLGITSVAAITVIVFLVCQGVKATALDNKWLPVIAGGAGAALGVAAMGIMPGYPAQDYITGAAVGIASGLAATGINQVYKQLSGAGDAK